MGNEGQLRSAAEKIRGSLDGVVFVEVVGLDMEDEREGAFDEAVEKATRLLGGVDALVNCYSYEGQLLFSPVILILQFCEKIIMLLFFYTIISNNPIPSNLCTASTYFVLPKTEKARLLSF